MLTVDRLRRAPATDKSLKLEISEEIEALHVDRPAEYFPEWLAELRDEHLAGGGEPTPKKARKLARREQIKLHNALQRK